MGSFSQLGLQIRLKLAILDKKGILMGAGGRKKAGDIFRESTYLFGEKTSFAEAYPQIEDIHIEVTAQGKGVDSYNRERRYTKNHLPGEFINCRNPARYGGGFQLGYYLHEMVLAEKNELEDSTLCIGNEGPHRGGRAYRKCVNTFKLKIMLTYKAEELNYLIEELNFSDTNTSGLERFANECLVFDKTVGAGLVPARVFVKATGRD